jgi:hypothetical protein
MLTDLCDKISPRGTVMISDPTVHNSEQTLGVEYKQDAAFRHDKEQIGQTPQSLTPRGMAREQEPYSQVAFLLIKWDDEIDDYADQHNTEVRSVDRVVRATKLLAGILTSTIHRDWRKPCLQDSRFIAWRDS